MTPAPVEPVDLARARRSARDRILACTSCSLHQACTGPVPFHGPVSARVVVVGEAPGRQEDQAGRPFVGPAGRLLRSFLADAGIDPDALAWANTISCFPKRTPTDREIEACRPNLAAQLLALRPDHVLLVGSTALSTFRPDLKVSGAHGRLMAGSPGPWWSFIVHHPSAALRDARLVDVLARDLRKWATILATSADFSLDWFALSCVVCGRLVDRYDPDGMAWCHRHHRRGNRGWEKAARARADLLLPAPASALAPALPAGPIPSPIQEALL